MDEECSAMTTFGDNKFRGTVLNAETSKQAQAPQVKCLSKLPRVFATHSQPGFGPSARQSLRDFPADLEPVQYNVPVITQPVAPKQFHHYNFWKGQSPTRNETDPAVSLAILTSPAKSFMAADGFEHSPRKYVVTWNAHYLLDPVVYTGDYYSLRAKSISKRRDLSIGSVFKFYTQHGSWQWEELDEDDPEPLVDYESVEHYSKSDTVINGYMGDKAQPTFLSLCNDINFATRKRAHRRKVFARERTASGFEQGFGPSPLSKVCTPETVATEEVQGVAHLMAEQELSEAIRAQYINSLLKPTETAWSDSDSDSDSESSDDEEPYVHTEAAINQEEQAVGDYNTEACLIPSASTQASSNPTNNELFNAVTKDNDILQHCHEKFEAYSSDNSPERSGEASGDVSDGEENEFNLQISSHDIHVALQKCISEEQHNSTIPADTETS